MLVDLFFFFQAEDGIRDLTVTGVQTCALPICSQADGLLKKLGIDPPRLDETTTDHKLYRSLGLQSAVFFNKEKFGSDKRSEEHTSELQSQSNLVCRLLLEKKKKKNST